MKKKKLLHRFLIAFKKVRFADRWLLVFMAVLMVQVMHNLFFHELAGKDLATIDVAIRTTAAAIFGYFISGSFLFAGEKHPENGVASSSLAMTQVESAPMDEGKTPALIGFTARPESISMEAGAPSTMMAEERGVASMETQATSYTHRAAEVDKDIRIKQQITIVGCIGTISLILLVIIRNYADFNPAASAAVSQLRDFLSASVGLLIGNSTRESR